MEEKKKWRLRDRIGDGSGEIVIEESWDGALGGDLFV